MKAEKNYLFQYFSLFIIILSCSSLIYYPLKTKKLNQKTRTMMLQLQRALLAYHEREEVYVPQTPLKGGELVDILKQSEDLKEPILNVFSNEPFTKGSAKDYILYRVEGENFDRYHLSLTLPNEPKPLIIFESPPKEN